MRRLCFQLIFLGLMAWSQPLGAQPLPVVGFLSTAAPAAINGDQVKAFQQGLLDGGFVAGRNVTIEYRWAADDYSRLRVLANELVQQRVTVIVAAGGHVSAMTARNATRELPIVFTTVTDPVKAGLVLALNNPGTNATGTAGLTSELDPKRLELLHDVKPSAALVGVLANPKRPGIEVQIPDIQEAADKLKLKLDVQMAGSDSEIEAAFEKFSNNRVDALLVTADPLFNNHRARVLAMAQKQSLPAVYQWREFVAGGGLMSYGPSITEAYYKAGANAALILKGAKPSEIPVVQPTKFQLVINRGTARNLGLTLSPALLSRADEVIE